MQHSPMTSECWIQKAHHSFSYMQWLAEQLTSVRGEPSFHTVLQEMLPGLSM